MKQNDFLTKVSNMIFKNELIKRPYQRVLLAVSGGADSVAMLLALHELGYNCIVAHCNFHLRGEESNRDEAFVRRLCIKLRVPVNVKHFNVEAYMKKHKVSMEMACRELRYTWFERLRKQRYCQCIAVAHHRDDSIETFFLNIFRGTGLAGVTGIKPRNGFVVRPLLDATRFDVLQYLKECNQDYVTDSTNLENEVLRNRIRNAILPVIDDMFPNARKQLQLTMSQTGEHLQLQKDLIALFKDKNRHWSVKNTLEMPYESLKGIHNKGLLLYEMAREYGFNRTQCEQATEGYSRKFSGYYYSKTHYMRIWNKRIVIKPISQTPVSLYPFKFKNVTDLPVKIQVQKDNNRPFSPSMVNGTTRVAFDASIMKSENVVLRRWKNGDKMIPFGMFGHKLLSDLLTDRKLDKEEKKNVWVLEVDGVIVWVVGIRAASAFRVKNTSKSYILLTCNQGE